MSQAIIKLEGGGAAEKPSVEIYKYFDKDVQRDTLLRNIQDGIQNYMNTDLRSMRTKRKKLVEEEIYKAMDAIANNDYNAVNAGFETTADIENSGQRFDPAGLAARYINQKLKEAEGYKTKEESKTDSKKKYSDVNLDNFIRKQGYTYDQFSNNETGLNNLRTILTNFGNVDFSDIDFEGSDFTNADNLKSSIDSALQAINDENGLNYDTESQLLRKLGLSPEILSLFKLNEDAASEQKNENIQSEIDKLKDANQEDAQAEADKNELFNQFLKKYYKDYMLNAEVPQARYKYADLKPEDFYPKLNEIGFNNKDFNRDKYLKDFKHEAYDKDTGWLENPNFDDPEFSKKLLNAIALLEYYNAKNPNGKYVYQDNNTGTRYYFDLATNPDKQNQYVWAKDKDGNIFASKILENNPMYQDYIAGLQKFLDKNEEYYSNLRNQLVSKNKKGGILKALTGDKVSRPTSSEPTPTINLQQKPLPGYDPEKEQDTVNKINAQAEKDQRTANILYLLGAAADLASIAIPNVPGVGTRASVATGVVGTVLANFADGFSTHGQKRTWKDYARAAGYGLTDAVQLYPGTGGAKAVSTAKRLTRIAPIVLAGAAEIGLTASEIEMWKKIGNGQFTKNDILKYAPDLFKHTQNILSITRASKNIKRQNALKEVGKSNILADGKIAIMTPSGKQVVNFEKLKPLQEQFKQRQTGIGANNEWFAKGKANAQINKNIIEGYDINGKHVPGLMEITGEHAITNRHGVPQIETGDVYDWQKMKLINDPKQQQTIIDFMNKRSSSNLNPDIVINNPNVKVQSKQTSSSINSPITRIIDEDAYYRLGKDTKKAIKEGLGNTSWKTFNNAQQQWKTEGTILDNYKKYGIISNKQGGIIKSQLGSSTSWWRNSGNKAKYDDSYVRDLDKWDDWYNIGDSDIINWLSQKNLTDSNINALNGVTSFTDADKQYNKRGYSDWNINYNNTGLNDFFGYNSDVNDYMGPSTWSRSKAYNILVNLASQDGGIKSNNGVLVYNPVDKQFKFTPNNPAVSSDEQNPNSKIVKIDNTYTSMFDKVKNFKESVEYNPNISELIRLAGTIHTNTVAANKTEDSLKATMRDSVNLQRQQYGDYDALSQGQLAKAQLHTQAKQNLTSDAELNNRTQSEAERLGLDKEMQGKQYYNQVYRDTREKAWQAEAQNKQNRNEVAWANTSAFNAIQKAKSDIQVARYLANWKSIHDYLAGKEYQIKDKNDRLNDIAYQQEFNAFQRRYENDPDYLKLQQLSNGTDYTNSTLNEMKELSKRLQEKYGDVPFEIKRKYVLAGKKGTKVTIKRDRTYSDRTFHRALKDTRDAHLKLMNNLSEVTKKLILKAMA